jgi:subtilisin family serine protease
MNYKRTAIAIGVALICNGSVTAADAANRYLVVFKADALPEDADAHIVRAGGKTERAVPEIGTLVASGDLAFVDIMAKDSAVLAVGTERMLVLPPVLVQPVSDAEIDPADDASTELDTAESAPTAVDNLYFSQWDMRRIGAPAVWSRLPLAGGTPTVAVLDTGVADNHPDLNGKVVLKIATSYCNAPGGPGNSSVSYPKYSSYVDLVTHPDWTPADGCTSLGGFFTHDFHGTHVAGTIAAKFGGGRVVGVAPAAAIAAYKVFDLVRQTDPDTGLTVFGLGAFDGPLFSAIVDAANRGLPVISMSLGGLILKSDKDGNAEWHAWDRIAKYANRLGTLIVASAGNDAVNLNGPVAHIPSDLPTVISTSATVWSELQQIGGSKGPYEPAPGSHDLLAFYSNFGAAVDISAPGGDCGPVTAPDCLIQYLILSTAITAGGGLTYAFAAGTSMATPHVSAVAAMVRALHPDWNPGQVRAYLKSTAEDIGPRQQFGHGMVDADKAVR